MIEIIIADDHRIFREGLISLLEDCVEIKVIAQASNGEKLMNLLKGLHPKVVLMDIEMPLKNGIETTKEIKEKYPDIAVIALSMHKQSAFVKQMLKAGISGYIPKDVGKEELIRAVRTVCKDGSYFPPEISQIVLLSLKDQTKEAQITARELEIIDLIVNQHTTDEIAAKLCISKHTVESHRQNILLKLELKNTAGLVKYAIENKII